MIPLKVKRHYTATANTKSPLRVRKDLRLIRSRLCELVTPEEMSRWISTQNTALDGRTPLEAIVSGDTSRVLQLLTQVEEGIYV